MAEVAKLVPAVGVVARVPLSVFIVGKVEAVSRFKDQTFTRVVCPAVDLYSKPSIVQIRSARRFGSKGDEVSVDCRLSGYTRKAFKSTDPETGEIMSITPVDHALDLVD